MNTAQTLESRLTRACKAIKDFDREMFADRTGFVVIFGSYAYGCATRTSDIDVLFVVDKLTTEERLETAKFIVELHGHLDLGLDYEISHEHKIAFSLDFATQACDGAGFWSPKTGDIHIPSIYKDVQYLESEKFLLRFFLDSMNHRHLVVRDRGIHTPLSERSREMLFGIILIAKCIKRFSSGEAVPMFLEHGGASGDYYLGFDQTEPSHRLHLQDLVAKIERQLAIPGHLTRSDNGFVVNPMWLDLIADRVRSSWRIK